MLAQTRMEGTCLENRRNCNMLETNQAIVKVETRETYAIRCHYAEHDSKKCSEKKRLEV